jgi:hypothetical protein
VKSKLAEIARYERDLVQVQKKKADIAKQIGATVSKLGKSQQRLADEQNRNQKRLLDDLRRQQDDFRRIQESRIRKTVEVLPRSVVLVHEFDARAPVSDDTTPGAVLEREGFVVGVERTLIEPGVART